MPASKRKLTLKTTRGQNAVPSLRRIIVVLIVLSVVVGVTAWWIIPRNVPVTSERFSGALAFKHVEAQIDFGPRPTGSEANRKTGDYIVAELEQVGWLVETQKFTYRDTSVRNIVGKAGVGRGPVIMIGAHYDTRMKADQDPNDPSAPVPGANDGASGVAVLLELARVLASGELHNEIWLAFFDAEDNGGIDGWEWIVGSSYMAQHLTITPTAVIVVDMIGDAHQQIYFDENSNFALSWQLFQIDSELGYDDNFMPVVKYSMLDDHTPFARRGIPSVDLIDFDYPYWHTTADTIDKVSSESLERVGRVVEAYIETPTHSTRQE
jgi:Zn-dependent M28 family amino/carboxypeptidase